MRKFLPQTREQWISLVGHVVGALGLAELASRLPDQTYVIIMYTAAMYVYAELVDLKHKVDGKLLSFEKIKAMLSGLDDKGVIWQWASPLIAVIIWSFL